MSLHQLSETNAHDADLSLLLLQGERALLSGDLTHAIELFSKVVELDPSNARIYLRQGLALFEYGSEAGKEKALLAASKKFKLAVQYDPQLVEAWHAWGNTLFLLGRTYQEHHYFRDAEEKYRNALMSIQDQPYESLAELFWDYGTVWIRLAEHSQEPVDLQFALNAFQKASAHQAELPCEFWIDFGLGTLLLAEKISDIRLNVKAVSCFKHAVSINFSCYEGWSNLAKAMQALYEQTHDEDHFSQANECYASSAQIKPQEIDLWLDWAQFLLDSGRRNQDIKRLRASIEKCHRAYAIEPDLPLALAIWAEALALLGEITDRLDLIYEAQNKILEALELDEESCEISYSHGMCLRSFASYFGDYDHYYQAIEKFQQGLSLDRTSTRLWHALAKTYFDVGDLESDTEALELSLRFFTKAIDLRPSSQIHFDHALALLNLGDLSHEKRWIELSVAEFEMALSMQKNAIYLHPDWLFHYACALDKMGDIQEEEPFYSRAIEIFSHVLMIDPDFPFVQHHLALALSHLGELIGDIEQFRRAAHYFRLAFKHDEENDQILLDLAIALIHIAERTPDKKEAEELYREAEHKLTQSARLGNAHAFYQLGGLYSILGQNSKSLSFLEKAEEFASLPPIEELLSDEWLDGVRSTSEFHTFLSKLEKKPTRS